MIIGSKQFFFESLPSTNSYALQLLKDEEVGEGTIIRANFQTKGRGQTGNRWESEDGKNLLISVILYPTELDPSYHFYITMSVSLAVCDFLQRYIPDCKIKWPNDIYVKNDKIAGILIENSIMGDHFEYSVVGIGLNINQKKFTGDAPNPVSLVILTGVSYDIGICLNQLASDLDKRYKQLISEDFSKIRREYTSQLYRLNEWWNFKDSKGLYSGKILSVSDNGHLTIKRESGGSSEYSYKEVMFIQ